MRTSGVQRQKFRDSGVNPVCKERYAGMSLVPTVLLRNILKLVAATTSAFVAYVHNNLNILLELINYFHFHTVDQTVHRGGMEQLTGFRVCLSSNMPSSLPGVDCLSFLQNKTKNGAPPNLGS